MWIVNLLRGYKSTDWRGSVETLAKIPRERLLAVLSNKTHASHVQRETVSADVAHRFRLGDIFASLSDNDAELHLMSYLRKGLWQLEEQARVQ